jgi:hypothetical protein
VVLIEQFHDLKQRIRVELVVLVKEACELSLDQRKGGVWVVRYAAFVRRSC